MKSFGHGKCNGLITFHFKRTVPIYIKLFCYSTYSLEYNILIANKGKMYVEMLTFGEGSVSSYRWGSQCSPSSKCILLVNSQR